jgi:hypothetical protein
MDHDQFTDRAYRKRILNNPDPDEIELSFVDRQAEDVALTIYNKYKEEPMFLGKITMALAKKASQSL